MRLHHRLGAVTAGTAAAATVATLFVGVGAAYADDDGPVDAGITINKIDGLPSDFINGVDVSSILSEEESGVVFHDFAGNVADPFDVLAEAGINYVRVRVWNDPFNSTTHLGYGAGNTDATRATEIAERATEAGMKVLVDFHYSDFWADPSKQKAPKAWAGFTVDQKATAAHDFTEDTLDGMKAAGVDVGMVQIGNETNGAVAGVSGLTDMSKIFSAGSAAVRTVYPNALVALHFTNPETANRYTGYAAQLQTLGVDYDVFASSYYPYWHGTMANLTSVLSTIATTYGKKVMVAETSYPYTYADGDGTTNSVTSGATTYPVSVQGQATEIRDTMAAVNSVTGGAGLGVFYWEPAWIPVPGATLSDRQALWAQYGSGWATTAAAEYDSGAPTTVAEGSGWDNQALFDYNGFPLESLRAFQYARTGAVAPKTMTSVSSPTVAAAVGSAITLPSTVTVTYNDSSTESQAVTWEDVLSYLTSAGTYTVHGTTSAGYATTATVTLTLPNSVANPSFESSAATPWTVTNGSQGCSIKATGDATSGSRAFAFYRSSAFTCSVQQTITGLTPGDYLLSAWSHGGAFTSGTMQLRGVTSVNTYNTPLVLTAWGEKHQSSEIVTVGSDGQIVVSGQITTANANAWGVFDDFSLTPYTASSVDTSGLAALVSQANGLTRSVYSDDSIAALDSALHIADIVLDATLPTQAHVDAATTLMTDALAGLVIVGDVPDLTVTNPTVTVVDGDPIALPATAKVTFFDGRFEQQSVTWDDVLGFFAGPGTYPVHGVTSGGLAVTATVKVKARDYLTNGDFETGDLTGWTIGTVDDLWPSHFWYDSTAGSVHGTTAVNVYGSSAFNYTLTQQVAGLAPGTYRLTAQAHGLDSGTLTGSLVATTSGGNASTPLVFSGWANWATFSVDVLVPEDGNVTVGVSGSGAAEDWGYFDDFTLTALPHDADTTALDAAVATANGIDRHLYVAGTLPVLDDALAAYAVFANATDPSQDAVDAMTQRIQGALDQLDLIDVAFDSAPAPAIGGTAKYGSTLTATVGTWVPTPSGLAYQWKRNGVAIDGANGLSYKLTLADIGATITFSVTATRADYITETKTSAGVKVAKATFTTQPTPTIGGKPVAGATLTAYRGSWSPTPSAFAYQWYRDGKAISGQRGTTYKVKTSDLGHKISVQVTASRTGFTTAWKTSAPVTVVKRFFSTGTATIGGYPKVGNTLTAHRGLWLPNPTVVDYQWYRNGAAISGATNSTYKLTSADKGKKVTVKVTVKKSGYLPTTVTSTAVTVK